MQNIHSSSIIEDSVVVGNNVKIGPFCHISGNVILIGDNCEIKSNVVITGTTSIGKNNVIFPFAVIGSEPQDLKFFGEVSKL